MKCILKDKNGVVRNIFDLKDSDKAFVKNHKLWVGCIAFPVDFDVDFVNGDYVVTGVN